MNIENNRESREQFQEEAEQSQKKRKAKLDAETKARNTDLAMANVREIISRRVSKRHGTTQVQIARREIQRRLTQMLELYKQEKKGRHTVLYLRVSTFPQAMLDIDAWNVVESTIVPKIQRQQVDEQMLKERDARERDLSHRERRAAEEREESLDGLKGSLLQQAKLCYKYAKDQGYHVVAIIVDIHTGYELHQREGMSEIRHMIKQGEIEVAVGLCLDRVSRNMLHTLTLVDEFNEFGVRLDCMLEVIDTSRFGMLMLAIKGWGNEDERERILRRTQNGKRDKIERGEIVGQGRTRYGYLWVKNERGKNYARKFDPATYDVVRKIGESYMAGIPMVAICRNLETEGILTMEGNKRWDASVISRILKDPVYRGVEMAGRHKTIRQGGTKRQIKNPDAYVYPAGQIHTPAYWTEEEAALIDAQFVRNQRDKKRNNRISSYEFLLRHPFIRCGFCGYSLTCEVMKKTGRPVYQCKAGSINRKPDGGERCPGCCITANELDQTIWEKVTPLLHNTGIMAELLAQLEKMDLTEQALTGCDNIIAKARKTLDRLTLSRASHDEEDPEDEEIIASLDRGIAEQKQIIKLAKEEKTQVLPLAQEQERRRASIRKFLNWAETTTTAIQENSTLTEKRDALSALGVTVYVFPRSTGCERWRMETTLEDFKLQNYSGYPSAFRGRSGRACRKASGERRQRYTLPGAKSHGRCDSIW